MFLAQIENAFWLHYYSICKSNTEGQSMPKAFKKNALPTLWIKIDVLFNQN